MCEDARLTGVRLNMKRSWYEADRQTGPILQMHQQDSTMERDATVTSADSTWNDPLSLASLYYWEGHLNLKEDSSKETGTWDFISPKASMPCVGKSSIIKYQRSKQDHPGIQAQGVSYRNGLCGPLVEGNFKDHSRVPVSNGAWLMAPDAASIKASIKLEWKNKTCW